MPSYKTHDPRGWCGDPKRGAAFGRHSYHLPVNDTVYFTGKVHLRRVNLDSGGYDPNGTYFGIGEPLYWCANEDCTVDFVLRASTREEAKRQVRKTYPSARFYR
jgi:hypothetical protein